MRKKCQSLSMVAAALLAFSSVIQAQSPYSDYSRWSLSANASVPFFFGDLTSISADRPYIGYMVGFQAEYRFSPLLGLSLAADYGENKAGTYDYSRYFSLDNKGYTCNCPPAPGDGSAMYYEDLYSDIRFLSAGLRFEFNLSYLFAPSYTPKRWTVLVSPAIYLQKYLPKVYEKNTDRQFTDGSLSNELSIGVGGDLSLRYRLSRSVDLQLRSGLIWISDEHFEGVHYDSKARSNIAWNTGFGIIFKLNGKKHKDNILYARRTEQSPIVRERTTIEQSKAMPPIIELPELELPLIQPPTVQPPVVVLQSSMPMMLSSVYFKRNSAWIDEEKYAVPLSGILALINEYPDAIIVISAYCDLTGTDKANKQVAKGRVDSMSKYLTRKGVGSKRIYSGYMGKEQVLTGPAAYSEAARRVEIVLKDQE